MATTKLNESLVEHPLLSFGLPLGLFKVAKIKLKFTKKLSLLLR